MRRVFTFDVECPASTLQTAPKEIATALPAGAPVKVVIVIPDGHSGLTGIALAVAHQPVLPYQERGTPGEAPSYVEGNDEVVPYDLEGYTDSGQWSAFVYNEDVNAHRWQVRYEIGDVPVAPTVAPVAPAPLATTAAGEVAPAEGAPEAPAGEGAPGEAPPGEAPPGEPAPAPPPEAAPPEPPAPAPAPEAEAPPGAPAPAEPGEPGAPAEPAPAPEVEGPPGEPAAAGEVPGAGAPHRAPAHHVAPARPHTVVRVSQETRPAGGWLPHGARFELRRTDQGQDFITNWRGKVIAPASGRVVHNLSDRAFPDGFGPHYCVVHIDSGRFGGRDWYVGHCTSHVNAGERFEQGHELATADQGHVEGGGWVELGEAPGGYPGPMGTGARYAGLFGPLTITRRSRVTVHAPGRRPPEHRPPAHAPRRPPAPRRAPVPAHHGAPPAHHAPAPPRRVEPPHAPPRPPYHPPPPRPAYHPPPPRPAYHPPPPPPRPAPHPPPRRR